MGLLPRVGWRFTTREVLGRSIQVSGLRRGLGSLVSKEKITTSRARKPGGPLLLSTPGKGKKEPFFVGVLWCSGEGL